MTVPFVVRLKLINRVDLIISWLLIGPESRIKTCWLNCHFFSVPIAKLNSAIKCQLLLIRVCGEGSHPKLPITEHTRVGSFPLSILMHMSLDRIGSVILKTNVNRILQDLWSDQDIDVSQKMEAKKKNQVKPAAANTTWNRLSREWPDLLPQLLSAFFDPTSEE